MKLEVKTIQLSDIVPQIYRADYFPFRPNERIGPRKSFVHSFVYIYEGKGSITIGTTVYSCAREELFYIPDAFLEARVFERKFATPKLYTHSCKVVFCTTLCKQFRVFHAIIA